MSPLDNSGLAREVNWKFSNFFGALQSARPTIARHREVNWKFSNVFGALLFTRPTIARQQRLAREDLVECYLGRCE